ncbi:MAG: IS1182 family transposase, partial [Pseudomonadota bacterium]
ERGDSIEEAMKRFRACSLDQPFLMPPSLQDWLPEDHLARFIAQVVGELDLGEICQAYQRRDGRGKAAYHPEMMVRVLLYCYATGVRSSRRIERASYEDVAVRYLSADQHPDHDTIAAFRREHLGALSKLFAQVLELCWKAGLVKLGQVAIDGTKMEANAGKHRNVGYRDLSEREREWAARVAEMLEEARRSDEEEDGRYGAGQRGDELPEALRTAEAQLERIRAAKQELEREAREKAEQVRREREAQGGKPRDEAQKKRWLRHRRETPAPASQGNLTDPESRLMVDGATKAYVQGYNAQLAVDGGSHLIVAQDVVTDRTDNQQLPAMLGQVEEVAGRAPELTTADAGYWNEWELQGLVDRGCDVLVAPERVGWRARLRVRTRQGPLARKMRQRLATEEGLRQYLQRQASVEPVFGWIKSILGYRKFLLRGLAGVRGEWSLICTAVNLRRLFRLLPAAVGV